MPRIVITGGPGVGKTTLLCELEARGYAVVPESAREVIRARKTVGLSPRPDAVSFAREVLARDEQKYRQTSKTADLIFFDRSPLEALAMLVVEGAIQGQEYEARLASFTFHSLVFMPPPWPEIYTQDQERDHTFEHCVRVHGELARFYARHGYAVREVPCLAPAARADHVLQVLRGGA